MNIGKLFPEKTGVDYSALKITEEGLYSITKRADGQRILSAMIRIIGSPKKMTITDVTGNVGGDTILFGMHFKHVDAIEMDPDNYAALENNVQVYGLKNVDVYHGDSTKVYKWETDVLYVDAPWGGPSYKEHAELDLYLGRHRVDTWISSILRKKWRPKFVFLKLPRNYKFDRLVELPHVKNIHHVQIRGYDLVGLEIE